MPSTQGTLNPSWRLSAEPVLAIGIVEGRSTYEFTRIMSAFTTENGDYVVANYMDPPEIRIFDASGGHRISVGGSGNGPGEFRAVSWVRPTAADGIVAYDAFLARLSFFTLNGEFVRTQSLPLDRFGRAAQYMLLDLLPDGSGLARPKTQAPSNSSSNGRSRAPLVRIDLVTGRVSSIAVVPDAEFVLTTSPRGYQRPSVVGLGLRASIAHFDGRLFYGSGDKLAVDEYDLTGQLVGAFERPYDRRPVTMADREAEAELFLSQQPAGMQTADNRKALRDAPYSDLMPALGSSGELLYAPPAIMLDEIGCLWIQEYVGPRDSRRTWSVFSADRTFLGTVSLPRTFMIREISRDRLLGVHEDSLGVQSLQVYAIRRDRTCGHAHSR